MTTRAQVDALWHAHNAVTEALVRYTISRCEDAQARAAYLRAEREFYGLYLSLACDVEDESIRRAVEESREVSHA